MLNKVFLIGRLGKDVTVKHFQNDSAIAEFSVATTESYKDREGKWVELTDWHNVKLPNKGMAERAEKCLKKGSLIHVEGKIKTRSFDDKDGNKRYVTEVVAERFIPLDYKKDESNTTGGNKENYGGNNSDNAEKLDDDLPF